LPRGSCWPRDASDAFWCWTWTSTRGTAPRRQHALPLVLVMGGGYARHIEDTVDIHMRTVALALSLWEGVRPQASR